VIDLADLGRIALGLALGAAVYATLSGALGLRRGAVALTLSARNALTGAALLTAIALLILLTAFVTHDFAIAFVAENSSLAMPAGLTAAAIWGGQSGSLLTWAWMLSTLGAVAAWRVPRTAPDLAPAMTAVLALLLTFFLGLLVFVSSPFEEVAVVPADGRGLNPLLWDTAMQTHPPVLTAGYVSFAIPFALAFAALLRGRVDRTWLRATRGWMLLAWSFQGAGLIVGAWWAYRVLGWGGYWGWDPVENVALVPWLLATAYLHSAVVQERRGLLKTWNVILALSTFVLSIFGTFVVRSGVLTSVHSFATSLIGPFFFGFLGLLTISAASLVLYRRPLLRADGRIESITSREAGFLVNNLLLVSIAAATFWGTIFPIVSEIIRGTKVAVGAPFYNQVNGPLMLALLALIGLGPLLSWGRTRARLALRRLAAPLATGVLVSALLAALGMRQALAVLAFGAAAFVLVAVVFEFGRGVRAYARHAGVGVGLAVQTVIGANRRRYGGYIVHLGMTLSAFAIIGTGFFKSEQSAVLVKDQPVAVAGYELTFTELRLAAAPDVSLIEAIITVVRPDGTVVTIAPGRQVHRGWESQPISRIGIDTAPPALDDLYLLLTAWDEDGASATLRVIVNPLVGYLWIGAVVFFAGVLVLTWPGATVRGPGAGSGGGHRMKFSRALLVALLLVLATPLLLAADEYENEMWNISEELACPVCAGQSIKDSNAPLAQQIRALILEKLAAGEDREAIIAFVVERYGEGVQLDPPKTGIQLAVWLGPLVILAIGLSLAATMFLRRARSAPADAGLDDYIARLDADLAERRDDQ
jgi:cytochrome c-type biogenesis protein CcmF